MGWVGWMTLFSSTVVYLNGGQACGMSAREAKLAVVARMQSGGVKPEPKSPDCIRATKGSRQWVGWMTLFSSTAVLVDG